MDNCLHQAVLVGEPAAVERAVEITRQEGLVYQLLSIDRAYHTPAFEPYTAHLRDIFNNTDIAPPKVPIYSSTTAAPYPEAADEVRKLIVDHWVLPVEFRNTVEALYEAGVRVFVEAGPRGNLCGFVDDILRGRDYVAVPANVAHRTGIQQLNHLVANLAAHDVPMDPSYLYQDRGCRTLDLEAAAGSTDQSPRRPISLSTGFPMLSLPESLAADLRSALAGGPPSAAAAGESTPGPSEAQGVGAPLASPAIAPAPQAAAPPAPIAGVASADMAGQVGQYLQTMDHFLAVQQQVMSAYLEPPAVQFPLLGELVAGSPGEEAVFERTFDIDQDLYLRDHTLGRDISALDPDLRAVAVMPLTMSLEIMAEAAVSLIPGQKVVGFSDVRAYRWLAWEEGPRVLRIIARRAGEAGGLVRVAIEDLTDSTAKQPAVQADVRLADGYPTPPVPNIGVPAGARASRWTPESLYEEGMFHGPAWRGVSSMRATAAAGCTAQLVAGSSSGFFAGLSRVEFVVDPVVLDAAGQVIGFWTQEQLADGQVIFPFQVAAIDLYGANLPAGALLDCAASITLYGSEYVKSDIELTGPDGRLWASIRGWMDKRFDLPPALRPLLSPAGDVRVAVDRQDLLPKHTPGLLMECRTVPAAVDKDADFWRRVWASRILGRGEREYFRALGLPDTSQIEWLALRMAGKAAVQDLLRAAYGLWLLPADIEILPDESGRLRVSGVWTASVPCLPALSLAHADGVAIALAALDVSSFERPRVAVEVQPVGGSEGYAALACTAGERSLFSHLPPALADEWLVRAWCAKQAAAGALGMRDGPSRITVMHPDTIGGQIVVGIASLPQDQYQVLPGAGLEIQTVRSGDLVFATTAWLAANPVEAGLRVTATP
jgi:hypothetical protein